MENTGAIENWQMLDSLLLDSSFLAEWALLGMSQVI